MANMIARLGVMLGLDAAEFNKGIDAAGKKLEQFSQSAEKFGKMGATALVAATAAALQYADELSDVAQANEVAIGTILKLSDALANNGGKADNAGKMLSAFSKFIDEAASGSDQAQKTAAKLGVSLKDIGTLSQEELLNKFVKNLGAINDPITRQAKAMEVFSKAAKGVDMVGFAEQMALANKVTKEQEDAIRQAGEMFDVLQQNARNTMLTIATEVGPTLKAFSDFMKELNGESNDFGQAFKVVFQSIAIVAANVLYVVKSIFGEMMAIGNYVGNLINKNWATAEAENDAYIKKTIQERKTLDDFYDRVMNPQSTKPSNVQKPPVGRQVSESKEAEKERLKTMRFIFEEAKKYDKFRTEREAKEVAEYTAFSKRVDKEEENLRIQEQLSAIENSMRDARQEDIRYAKDLFLAEEKRLENIREINQNNLLGVEAKKDLIDRENALYQATEKYLFLQNQVVKKQREGTSEEGFTRQFAKFLRDMPTELEIGAKAFDSLMGNMESAIDRFVRTGKLSFKDLARSIIQDLIAIQLKASATGLLRMLGQSFGIGGGFMNEKGGMELSGSLGFADGGDPPVGKASIVGERGPELFVPRTAGTIIPNHALSSMGGTTNVTNNYINAIDTKSFEDRLLGSSKAIWAANKYGEKNLATNYGRT